MGEAFPKLYPPPPVYQSFMWVTLWHTTVYRHWTVHIRENISVKKQVCNCLVLGFVEPWTYFCPNSCVATVVVPCRCPCHVPGEHKTIKYTTSTTHSYCGWCDLLTWSVMHFEQGARIQGLVVWSVEWFLWQRSWIASHHNRLGIWSAGVIQGKQPHTYTIYLCKLWL